MLGVGDTKCGICKPKLGIYKPYWAVRRIGRNFAASIWASARIDCEVDASFTKWACMDDEGVLTLQRRCRQGMS